MEGVKCYRKFVNLYSIYICTCSMHSGVSILTRFADEWYIIINTVIPVNLVGGKPWGGGSSIIGLV